MFRVRYYDELYHPDHFKRGMRGWFIVACNWLRWKLETFVQKQCLKFFVKMGQLPRDRKKELLRTFHLDVQAEELQKEQTSPLHEKVEQEIAETPRSRAERYTEGRKATMLQDLQPQGEDLPQRPQSLNNLIGQYGFNTRAKSYAHGRRFLADPEGDFEPVVSEEDSSGSVGTSGGGGSGSGIGGSSSGRSPLVARPKVAEDRRYGR